MVDQDSKFDGKTARCFPLGGTESAFVSLAEAFAKLGHEVLQSQKLIKVFIIMEFIGNQLIMI